MSVVFGDLLAPGDLVVPAHVHDEGLLAPVGGLAEGALDDRVGPVADVHVLPGRLEGAVPLVAGLAAGVAVGEQRYLGVRFWNWQRSSFITTPPSMAVYDSANASPKLSVADYGPVFFGQAPLAGLLVEVSQVHVEVAFVLGDVAAHAALDDGVDAVGVLDVGPGRDPAGEGLSAGPAAEPVPPGHLLDQPLWICNAEKRTLCRRAGSDSFFFADMAGLA